jgi:hypothetical protein
MATSVTTSLPLWLAGCTYDGNGGNDLRNSGVSPFFYDPGIATGSTISVLGGVVGGSGLLVAAGTGMTVTVGPGHFVVPNTATPTAGGYVSTLSSQGTLTVQTADPTNPRIDIIVANVVDNGNNTSLGEVQIITGSASPSPSAPTAPTNSITLAQLSVPATTTSITGGLITDKRTFTTATGGVLVAPKGSVTGYSGQLAYDKASDSFYHNNNSTATQLKVLPWQPVVATRSSNFTWDGSEQTVLSATFVADGYTDAEVFFKWPALVSNYNASLQFNVEFRMYIDSTQIDAFWTPEDYATGYPHSGGSWSYYTSAATGDTPSAGTHTIKVTGQNQASWAPVAGSTVVVGLSTSKQVLRIKPVSR